MANLSDLTPRELEVLQLVLAGWTNKAIAAEILVCEKRLNFISITSTQNLVSAPGRW
jgi:FixJ family two-component response regulator